MLSSTASPAHFHPNWAGLAVLFRRQLLKDFSCFVFNIACNFHFYFKYETHAAHFCHLSAVGRVNNVVICSALVRILELDRNM